VIKGLIILSQHDIKGGGQTTFMHDGRWPAISGLSYASFDSALTKGQADLTSRAAVAELVDAQR